MAKTWKWKFLIPTTFFFPTTKKHVQYQLWRFHSSTKRLHTTLIQFIINIPIKKQLLAILLRDTALQLVLGGIKLFHNKKNQVNVSRNFISESAGCRLWTDSWTDPNIPLCQDVKGLITIDQATKNLSFTDPTSITRMTGCQEAFVCLFLASHFIFWNFRFHVNILNTRLLEIL